jgi:hypothetical protein
MAQMVAVVRKIVLLVAVASMLSVSAQAAHFTCQVDGPISAAELNTGGTWSFEVFDGIPAAMYLVKVNWPGDPSNGAHTNSTIGPLDATGHGVTTLPRYWSPDGFLPGYFAFIDPVEPISGFVAVPGSFTVQVLKPDLGTGTAKCQGEVL